MTTAQAEDSAPSEPELVACTQWQMVRYFLYLGAFGFGGPIALTGYMRAGRSMASALQ
jgi:chromate transporter